MSMLDIATTDRRSAEAETLKLNENILGGRMTHSISTPSGVDGAISTLGHRGGKKLTVRIQMLDDTVTMFQVQAKALGKVLFEQVCRQLNLLEADYFGLEYQEMSTHTKYWLDLEKPLNRQVGFSLMDPMLRFCVKFYTPDPAQLEEEYTRYLFCLQIKRDLASGSLQCNDNTAALMASYIVQASCGDFVPEDYPDHTYLSSYRFVPHQDDIMQRKIMENHKKHVGQSPAEADMNLLETARRCELYGMKMHAAKDIEGVPLNLAVAHMGITVFQNITRINTFSWAKIRKISFKRKRFLIKLHPEGYGYYKDTVEFYFEGRNECKNFWKKCVENHGFFRCITVQKQPRRKSRVLSRGSSFRYSGKTQKQMIEFVRENYVKRQTFQRSQSFRQGTFSSSSRCQSKTYVNSSISANPLLPVNTADWDCHNPNSALMTSLGRREMVTLDHQQNIHTDSTSTQIIAAQVEILPAKNSSAEMQDKEAAKMNHSVLVQDPQLRNSLNNNNKTNMSANALELEHMRQNFHNFGRHPLNHLYSNTNNSPLALAEFQAYATALPQQQQQQHLLTNNSSNNSATTHLTDLNSSIELEQEEEEDQEEEINSDLMLPTSMKRENNITMSIESSPILSVDRKLHLQESCSQTVTPIYYSSTKFSTSKRCINSNSTETETDNIIYTDIDVEQSDIIQACQIENKISNRENFNLNDKNDIYATINHETKLKSREKHLSDEYLNRKISQYVQTKHRNPFEVHNKQQEKYKNIVSDKSSSSSSRYHNDLDHPSNYSLLSFITKSSQESSKLHDRFSNFDNLITQSVDSQNTASGNKSGDSQNNFLPKKCDYFGIDSLDSYDSHYITHHPFINMNAVEFSTHNNNSQLHYVNRENVLPLSSFVGNRLSGISHTSPTKTFTDMVDYDMSSDYFQSVSQPEEGEDDDVENEDEVKENIYDQVQKETWLKSSSCKNFNDLAIYFDCEHLYKEKILDKNFLSLNRIDSPITRFDDTGNSSFTVRKSTNTLKKSCSPLRDAKKYSNSYPGSIYSTHDRRHSNHVDTCSQDDLSQDSYELLEKYANDMFVAERSRSQDFQHSCSLDSGNYIPSEDEGTDSEEQRYRSAMDVNCKSAADIMNEIWDSEDPRYLPREKMCVKSDGSFYKKIKEVVLSHSTSPDSRKSHDSLYYTDSKKSRETSKSKSSIVSGSPDLKENIFVECIGRYEMPTTTGKKLKQFKKEQFESGHDTKTEFYQEIETKDRKNCKTYHEHQKIKSHDCLLTDSQNTTENSLNYDSRDMYLTFPSNRSHKTSKVHSISLQNVEMEKNTKPFGVKSPLSAPSYILNRENKEIQTNDSIDNAVTLKESDLTYKSMFQLQHSSESTNIFSFDQDHIEDIQKYGTVDNKTTEKTDYPLTPELISEFDKQQQKRLSSMKSNWRDELMAKTHFEEYNPSLNPNCTHTTVERTKSDPNSLANRSRLGLNSRRHVLMHQKSIDLTPADSSDEDYIYKQIPSAPPVCKSHGNFEIPKCFETNTNNGDTSNSVTPSYFKMNERRSTNPTKEEITYILHKRHIVNSSNSPQFEKKYSKPKSPKSPKHTKTKMFKYEAVPTAEIIDVLHNETEKSHKKFCLTNPMDTKSTVSSFSKSVCLKQLDLSVIEKLNKKLSQIESDSATSSHTESLQHRKNKLERKEIDIVHNLRQELQGNSRKNSKSRIITKSKISKPKKSKTRITSFSSDDESIDSDDVFGSAEAISNKLDFSPPQSRKEIEPILRIEQNRLISATWGRGQTMSSTEIEGSPPQCRRLAELENRYHTPKLDLPHINNSELRRISERSLSIPSSEDEHNVPLPRIDVCTNDYQITENIPSPIFEMAEFIRSNDEYDIDYTLIKNNLRQTDVKQSKSKIIEEMIDSSIIKRCKGHAPILFAHARLNLSEGSVSLQRQMATQQNLFSFDRRTKSLDAPVISLHKLPSMNAFSSKDDTVSFEEEAEILEEKPLHINTIPHDDDPAESVKSCAGFIPTQDFSSVGSKEKLINIIKLDKDEIELLEQIALIEKIALQSVKIKMKKKSKVSLKSGNHLILDIPKYGFNEWSPCNSGASSRKTSPAISRAGSYENASKDSSASNLSKPFDLFKPKSNNNRSRSRRTSADDIKSNDYKKKIGEKCRARSNENQKLNRDKSKSQEETEADIKARKERQQKLYESAIKQTKTLLSPVTDKPPVFPTPKDKISVKTEGDKIIIETEFKSKVEDHVLIAKSPRNLDTSLIQFSRSFDERRSSDKLDKANRSFEDRNKSFEESDKLSSLVSSSDGLLKTQSSSQDIKYKIEGPVVYNTKLSEKSNSLEKSTEAHISAGSMNAKTFDDKKKPEAKKLEASKLVKRSSTGDRRMFAHQFQTQEDVDMQAVISERRSLEIYKRSLTSEETKDSECNASRKPSTTESIDSYVSFDNSHSPLSKSPIPSHDTYPYRVPTIECEEASIEEDDNCTECHHLKVLRTDTNRLSLDRSKSDETGSWMTVECDEFVGSDTSDNDNPRTLDPERFILEAQTTLEDACPLEYSNCVTPTSDLSKMITPPYASPLVEMSIPELFDSQKLNTENSPDENAAMETAYLYTSTEKRIKLEDVRQEFGSLGNMKEKSSIEDESSVSCSIARPLGISQEFGDREAKKSWEIKEKILKLELNTEISIFGFHENNEKKGRLSTKKQSTPVLEKQNQIDLDIHSEIAQDSSEDEPNKTFKPFEKQFPQITETKTISLESENSSNDNDNSKEVPSSIDSKKNTHIDLRIAFEERPKTYGAGAQSKKPKHLKNSTGNESSVSSNTDVECSDYERGEPPSYILHEVGNIMSKSTSSGSQKENDNFPDELNDFPTNIGYPALTCGIGINQSDIVGFSPTFTVGRTLSRISERSTASEKSSIEDDISKASTHSASLRDESVALTDHHPSLSSDSRSNTNLAYMSEADRRTSAEMPEIPCDSATGDKLSSIESINDPKSPTVVKGRFSVTQIIEGQSSGDKPTLLCLSNAGSQDSEDWPLPEIPFDHVPVKPVECLFSLPDLDKPVPKTFCWKLNDLHEVSSPPSKHSDTSITENSQEYLKHDFQTESDVEFDAFHEEHKPDLLNIVNYEDTSYFMPPFHSESNKEIPEASTCFKSTFNPGSCLSSSFNASCTSLRKIKEKKQICRVPTCEPVIMSQPTRSPPAKILVLDDEHFPSNCAVGKNKTKFDIQAKELASPSQSPNSLNTSYEEINQAISGVTGLGEQKGLKSSLRMSTSSCRKFSHSSHSEEETSSIGTDVEGTVRMGYQQNKCTHSSHSEDTSIGLSISEWSGGTNTVKQYANLSGSDSISAASYIKSEKSHATKSSMSSINKSIESLNDQSASGSNKFSFDNGGSSEGFRYEVFSNSETEKASDTTSATKSDDTIPTLTEIMHSLSEWSTSTTSSRTIVGYTTPNSNPVDDEPLGSRIENASFENRRIQTQYSAKNAFFEDKKDSLAKIHKVKDSKYGVSNEDSKRKPFFREYEESENPIQRSFSTEKNEKEYVSKGAIEKKSSSMKLRENTDQHYTSFVEKLYSPKEKLSERYQSQDFSSIKVKNEHQSVPDANSSTVCVTKKNTESVTCDSTKKTVQSMPTRRNFIEMKFNVSKDYTDDDVISNKKTRQSATSQEPIHFKSQELSNLSNETIGQSSFKQADQIRNEEISEILTVKQENISHSLKTSSTDSCEIKDNALAKAKSSEHDTVPIKPARSKKRQRQNVNP